MDALMIVLRIIHIFSGLIWLGLGLVDLFVFSPALQDMAANKQSVAAALANRIYSNKWYVIGFPVAATLTVLAGFWLYYRTSDGFNGDWMSLRSSMVLSTGVVLGIIALIHGGAVMGPTQSKVRQAAAAIQASENPSDAQWQEFNKLKASHTQHGYISLVLVVLTLLTMASFRYFGS